MYPALEHLPRAGRPDKPEPLHFLFQFGLQRRADIEIAGGHAAAGPELHRRPTDENRARKTALVHGFADLREKTKGCFEFGAVGGFGQHGGG